MFVWDVIAFEVRNDDDEPSVFHNCDLDVPAPLGVKLFFGRQTKVKASKLLFVGFLHVEFLVHQQTVQLRDREDGRKPSLRLEKICHEFEVPPGQRSLYSGTVNARGLCL